MEYVDANLTNPTNPTKSSSHQMHMPCVFMWRHMFSFNLARDVYQKVTQQLQGQWQQPLQQEQN
jgi:hypothetical protein